MLLHIIGAIRSSRNSRLAAPRTGAVAVVVMMAALSGCDTIAQDFDLLARNLAPPTPTQAAEMMVDQHNPDQRRAGVTWIANSPFGGADPYLRQYRLMVEIERDPTALSAAIRALARHGEPSDATLLAPHLRHRNQHVRWEAARGLQRLHNPDVISDLLAVLRDGQERSDVRVAAAHALGQYPQDRVFQALVSALDARELAVNQTAEQSLATLTGRDLGNDPREWLEWYNSAPVQERFADQREYRFATYTRDETMFERIAFWQTVQFEQPAPPAGLRSPDQRRTYDDDADQAAGDG
jgi:HEAT repeat protein